MSFNRRIQVDIISGTCSHCGKDYIYYANKKMNSIFKGMKKYDACPTCASWLTREKILGCKEVMVDGKLYALMPYKKSFKIRLNYDENEEYRGYAKIGEGDGGYIMNIDTLTSLIYKSKILIGEPPEPFRTPDTAVFIPKRHGVALRDGPFECSGKTCLDRYTCLFYIKEKVEGDSPANKIPKGWKDGGERCMDYINISEANKFLLEWRNQRQ